MKIRKQIHQDKMRITLHWLSQDGLLNHLKPEDSRENLLLFFMHCFLAEMSVDLQARLTCEVSYLPTL
jgi:hypothetical protein